MDVADETLASKDALIQPKYSHHKFKIKAYYYITFFWKALSIFNLKHCF